MGCKECKYYKKGKLDEAVRKLMQGDKKDYLSIIGMSEEEYQKEVLDPAWKWHALNIKT